MNQKVHCYSGALLSNLAPLADRKQTTPLVVCPSPGSTCSVSTNGGSSRGLSSGDAGTSLACTTPSPLDVALAEAPLSSLASSDASSTSGDSSDEHGASGGQATVCAPSDCSAADVAVVESGASLVEAPHLCDAAAVVSDESGSSESSGDGTDPVAELRALLPHCEGPLLSLPFGEDFVGAAAKAKAAAKATAKATAKETSRTLSAPSTAASRPPTRWSRLRWVQPPQWLHPPRLQLHLWPRRQLRPLVRRALICCRVLM